MEEDYYGYNVAITIFMVLIAGIIAIIINYTNGALNNFLINLSRSWIWYFMGCAILNRLILEVLKIIITNLKKNNNYKFIIFNKFFFSRRCSYINVCSVMSFAHKVKREII